MRTSALFGAKYLEIFRNLWCIRKDKGGRGSCADRGGGSIFRDFVRTSFMDAPFHSSGWVIQNGKKYYQYLSDGNNNRITDS